MAGMYIYHASLFFANKVFFYSKFDKIRFCYYFIIALLGGDRAIVIYLDVFFIINFLMDTIVLVCLNRFCGYAATWLRILLSSTLGALWSVIVLIVPKDIVPIVHICTYIFISIFMVRICSGKIDIRNLIKGVVMLYAITFVIAGCLYMFIYYTPVGYSLKEIVLKDSKLTVFLAITLIILVVIGSQIKKITVYEKNQCQVEVTLDSVKFRVKGYIDTGNILVDPILKKPVSVIEADSIPLNIQLGVNVKLHLIPYNSLGCENGLLEVVTAENMCIYQGKKMVEVPKALLGISRHRLSSDGEFNMLVNSNIFNA